MPLPVTLLVPSLPLLLHIQLLLLHLLQQLLLKMLLFHPTEQTDFTVSAAAASNAAVVAFLVQTSITAAEAELVCGFATGVSGDECLGV